MVPVLTVTVAVTPVPDGPPATGVPQSEGAVLPPLPVVPAVPVLPPLPAVPAEPPVPVTIEPPVPPRAAARARR